MAGLKHQDRAGERGQTAHDLVHRMLISFCIPVCNRTYDLKRTMPKLMRGVRESPPVEIAILNYNSHDDLDEYIGKARKVWDASGLPEGSRLTYNRFVGRGGFYHMAHARNLSVLASSGDVIVIFSADLIPHAGFVEHIRQRIAADDCGGDGPVWLHGAVKFVGVIACRRAEFISAGGYDERFEFYGPEDKDLLGRLVRRGGKSGEYPEALLDILPTRNQDKVRNYRLPLDKAGMKLLMRPIFDENRRRRVKVANEGVAWGQWV